jgi:hypothetical protein
MMVTLVLLRSRVLVVVVRGSRLRRRVRLVRREMGGRRVRFSVRFFVSILDLVIYITGVLGIQLVTIYVLSSKLDFIVNIFGHGNV